MAGLAYFTPADVVVSFAGAGSTLVPVKITKFSATLNRNIEASYFSGSPLPGDVEYGKFETGLALTTKPDDLSQFRAALCGSSSGSTPSKTIVTGGLSLQLVAGTAQLKIEAARIPWSVEFPSASASGGAAEVEFKCDSALGTLTSSPIKVTLINDVENYSPAA
jgi:hypothetical protein